MKILITGTAGFIGFHLAQLMLERGDSVVGIDNINDYYDTGLKFSRLSESGISAGAEEWNRTVQSTKYPNYQFIRMNLEDREAIDRLFDQEDFDIVCNLAAQAGVRYSIENPHAYINSNITGFMNILEACRHHNIKHLVYASSSSVYGNSRKMPLSVTDNVDNPVSLYAATKKSNELMAYTYSHLYGIPVTGLRFFTVYGPWGRPDMAYFLFTRAILEGTPVKVFNYGDMYRDFTYIDDITAGVAMVLSSPPDSVNTGLDTGNKTVGDDKAEEKARYKIYNIGNSSPVKLLDFIDTIEKELGKKAVKEFCEMQPGDVYKTYAEVIALQKDFGYAPDTPLRKGIAEFVKWYRQYYL
jgi:UDP-glucuronate 4-epimerase